MRGEGEGRAWELDWLVQVTFYCIHLCMERECGGRVGGVWRKGGGSVEGGWEVYRGRCVEGGWRGWGGG